MSVFKIYNRFSGALIFERDCESMRVCVELAIKSGANLSGANLYCAYVSGANLSGADLSGADLSRANLSRANLSCADLSDANLSRADLSRADLSGANLSCADLYCAHVSSADLSRADLSGADLSRANLSRANLSCAKNAALVQAQTEIVPRAGEFSGWKKCRDGVIVELVIPGRAKRCNATGRKCRASYVRVKRVYGSSVGISIHDGKTEYRAGKIVRCDKWEPNRFIECGGGIHFYLTREEAEAHS